MPKRGGGTWVRAGRPETPDPSPSVSLSNASLSLSLSLSLTGDRPPGATAGRMCRRREKEPYDLTHVAPTAERGGFSLPPPRLWTTNQRGRDGRQRGRNHHAGGLFGQQFEGENTCMGSSINLPFSHSRFPTNWVWIHSPDVNRNLKSMNQYQPNWVLFCVGLGVVAARVRWFGVLSIRSVSMGWGLEVFQQQNCSQIAQESVLYLGVEVGVLTS